jgi:hypothetical protein
MIPLKKPEMQGAKFSRNETYIIVRRSDWKIEATPQIGFFKQNQTLNQQNPLP